MDPLFGEEMSDISDWEDEDESEEATEPPSAAQQHSPQAPLIAAENVRSPDGSSANQEGDDSAETECASAAPTSRPADVPASVRHNVVALISGGKDSVYAMVEAVRLGHTIQCVANLHPSNDADDDIDSWTYQTVGHSIIPAIAEALDLPLIRAPIVGKSVNTALQYTQTKGDEVEDLFRLIQKVKQQFPSVTAVLSGAVLSNYQRTRVEDVCLRLGLAPLAFLWQRDQYELVTDIVDSEVDAIVAKVACIGLGPSHVGRHLSDVVPTLVSLHEKFGVHVAGEGGEYETLTVDAPIYKSRIVVDDFESVLVDDNDSAPVALMRIKSYHLEPKTAPPVRSALPTTASPAVPKDAWSAATASVKTSSVNAFAGDIAMSHNSLRAYATVSGDASKYPTGRAAIAAAFTHLGHVLKSAQLDFRHVVHIRVSLPTLADFANLNSVFSQHFGGKAGVLVPSRSCVASSGGSGKSITLRCVLDFEVRREHSCPEIQREVLHVRSVSRWAPVCIGPYSQSNQVLKSWSSIAQGNGAQTEAARVRTREVFLAGQIALVPQTMDMLEGDWRAQLQLLMKNIAAVLKCSGSDAALVHECHVFVTPQVILADTMRSVDAAAAPDIHNGVDKSKEGFCIRDAVKLALTAARTMHFIGGSEWDGILSISVVDSLPRNAEIEVEVVAIGLETSALLRAQDLFQQSQSAATLQSPVPGLHYSVIRSEIARKPTQHFFAAMKSLFVEATSDEGAQRRFLRSGIVQIHATSPQTEVQAALPELQNIIQEIVILGVPFAGVSMLHADAIVAPSFRDYAELRRCIASGLEEVFQAAAGGEQASVSVSLSINAACEFDVGLPLVQLVLHTE